MSTALGTPLPFSTTTPISTTAPSRKVLRPPLGQCTPITTKCLPPPALKALHKRYGTTAFLIIKGDSLWHEQYFEGYTTTTKSNSFSMAKSYVCALLGKAIAEGYIKGLDQKVGDFLPEFRTGLAQSLTVGRSRLNGFRLQLG